MGYAPEQTMKNRVLLFSIALVTALAPLASCGRGGHTRTEGVDFITVRDGQYETSLTHLGLDGMRLTDADIEPLRHITNAVWMDLSGNRISDISALSGLTNLTMLTLSGNRISDISPLAGLVNIESLGLRDNPVGDWSPVAHIRGVAGRSEE
jgi:hypothetical protein